MYKEQETMKNNQANSTIKELLGLQDTNGVVRQLGSGWMQGRPVLCVGNLKWHCHLHRHSRVSTGKWPGGGGHKKTAWVQLLMGVLWECLLPCPGTLGYRGNCSPLC